jgi:hypothetical protein
MHKVVSKLLLATLAISFISAQDSIYKVGTLDRSGAPPKRGHFESKSTMESDMFTKPVHSSEPIKDLSGISCPTCRVAMNTFDSIFQSDKVVTKIEGVCIDICLKYLSYGEDVCTEMVDRMAPIIIHVLANSFLESDYMCAEILGICSTPVYTKEYAKDYVDAMLATKPEIIQDNNYVNSLYAKIKADPNPRPTFKAVHISDLHMDYSY